MRSGLALATMATLTACAVDQTPTIRSVIEGHRRAIDNPRPIDLAIRRAAAEAEAACGGPVALNVDGDPANYGSDPSDYECLPR